jgi:hypothetical protein
MQDHATVRVWKNENHWRLQAPSRLWGDTDVTLAATQPCFGVGEALPIVIPASTQGLCHSGRVGCRTCPVIPRISTVRWLFLRMSPNVRSH